jgi:Rrf2 family protein
MITGNTHFTIAVHMLAAMAIHPGQLLSSTELATTVPTNPAFLRAVLSRLREAGIVRTVRGKSGGNTLARAAGEISLLQVFRAIEGEARLTTHDCSKSECRLAARIPAFLDQLGRRVDAAMARELEQISLAQLAESVSPFESVFVKYPLSTTQDTH